MTTRTLLAALAIIAATCALLFVRSSGPSDYPTQGREFRKRLVAGDTAAALALAPTSNLTSEEWQTYYRIQNRRAPAGAQQQSEYRR